MEQKINIIAPVITISFLSILFASNYSANNLTYGTFLSTSRLSSFKILSGFSLSIFMIGQTTLFGITAKNYFLYERKLCTLINLRMIISSVIFMSLTSYFFDDFLLSRANINENINDNTLNSLNDTYGSPLLTLNQLV